VQIVTLPDGFDPDSYLKEKGREAFIQVMEAAEDYLTLLVRYYSKDINSSTPAGKNEMASMLSKQIRSWNHPLMVHEALRKLAHHLHVPESMLGVGQLEISNIYLKKYDYAGVATVDPDWILEVDVLRWLIRAPFNHPAVHPLAKQYLTEDAFLIPVCKELYRYYCTSIVELKPIELLNAICQLEEEKGQKLLEELSHKKIPMERAQKLFSDALQKILERNWMAEREKIRMQIHSGTYTDEEALELAKKFESKRAPPKVLLCPST
jgi:DNA primase